ncbi:MAG TPA: hypothetical protein VKH19_11040 [Gemmatimonadaceae bacterium]|nr:hypothetical protein [Gemmatimonadaceae bacterium]
MFGRRIRRVALIGPVGDRRISVHTGGYPLAPDRLLPDPDVVVLVQDRDDTAMLFRYTAYGELCGDTPHESVDEAQRQAETEYGEALFPWIDVPPDVRDVHTFAIKYAEEHLNQRGE